MQRKEKNSGEFKHLPVSMRLSHVKQVAQKYGIDVTGEHIIIEREADAIGIGIAGDASPNYKGRGRIHLLPDAFQSEEGLARTIYHEKIHLDQYKKYGYKHVSDNREIFEEEAYRLEDAYFQSEVEPKC